VLTFRTVQTADCGSRIRQRAIETCSSCNTYEKDTATEHHIAKMLYVTALCDLKHHF